MLDLTPSRFNILVPLTEGRILAYNSWYGGLAVWSAAEQHYYDRVVAGDPEVDLEDSIADDMKTGGYLVPRDTDELSRVEEQYLAGRSGSRTMVLTIAPTLACNFGCDYCFQGQHKPGDTMSPEVQDAILALIESAAPDIDGVSVTWYGGEPLTRKSLIRELSGRIIRACSELRLGYSASMISNGYLLDAETARWLHEHRVRDIQITLDGGPTEHDGRRHLLGGQGTFARITENLRAVVEAVPELLLSIRVNIDSRNGDDARSLVDHMVELGLGGRPNLEMYFAAVEASNEGCHQVQDVCMHKAAYADLETELYRYAHEKGLSDLPYPGRFSGSCSALSPRGYVIAPSGDIHKCWETISYPHQAVGSVFDMESWPSRPAARRWSSWTPFDNESCRSCRLLPSCAGRCAHRFIYASEVRGAAILPCPSWKYAIKERLLLRAETMGAVGPGDYEPETTRTDPDELCVDALIDTQDEASSRAMPPTHGRAREVRRLPVLR